MGAFRLENTKWFLNKTKARNCHFKNRLSLNEGFYNQIIQYTKI